MGSIKGSGFVINKRENKCAKNTGADTSRLNSLIPAVISSSAFSRDTHQNISVLSNPSHTLFKMNSKFPNLIGSGNCNILQPKHLNSSALSNADQREVAAAAMKNVIQQSNSSVPPANFLSLASGFNNNGGVDLGGLATFNDATGIPPRKGPNTMAKRNARERNRVKLVNQGFQTLRQHIPEDYRVKKMSKVDVLRCALYYIRSLEQKLQLPFMSDEIPSSMEDLMSGGNSSGGVDAYSFNEGVLCRQQLEKLSYDQHISSLSKSTSSELGDGDSSFSFSDDDDFVKEGIKKQRLAQDHNAVSAMCTLAMKKQENVESYVYHQYKEEMGSNKSTMRTEPYKSQIFMMVASNNAKIAHGSIDSHYLAVEDTNVNPIQSQCIKEEMENNDENYHSRPEWDDKVDI